MRTTVHGKPAAPVLGALLIAGLTFALAQTMIAPALPGVVREYDTTPEGAAWLMTGYLLAASVATPLAGKLGDLFGKARVLTVVLVLFFVGNVVCVLADSIEGLIAGRLIQGVAGGVFPLSFGIINDELPAERRATAIGLMSAMFGIGGGIGLPLAGVIVDNADLSWLFATGLLALPAAVAVWMLVPPSPARERTPIDWTGAFLLSAGLAAILFGISRANAWGWASPEILGFVGGGLLVLAGFVRVEAGTAQPLVDMGVMRRRAVLATNITGFLVGMAMFGSFLLVPQFAQTPEASGYGFGMTVTQAGLMMLPSSIVMLLAGPFGGVLGNRIGFRQVLGLGALLCCLSFALLAVAHDSVWQFIASNVLLGLGISFAFASMINLVVASVDPRDVGIATGINTVTRTVGGAFGSAFVTALLTAELIPGTRMPTEAAYTEAFAISALLAALAVVSTAAIPRARRAPRPAAAPSAPAVPVVDPASRPVSRQAA